MLLLGTTHPEAKLCNESSINIRTIYPSTTHHRCTMQNLYQIDVPEPFVPVCLITPRYPAKVTLTDTFTREMLTAWCAIWGAKIGRTLTARRMDRSSDCYLVHDVTDLPRITRAHYPYSTMEVGASFAIPMVAERNMQTLRVWTSQQGIKLKRKFSLSREDDEYIITRKA